MLTNVTNLVNAIGNIVDLLIPIAFAVALLFFFWGLAKFILASGNEEAKAQGKNIMIWGILALFVMAAIWGIINFIGTALGIDRTQQINVPGVNR
jgi:hypothetical protein